MRLTGRNRRTRIAVLVAWLLTCVAVVAATSANSVASADGPDLAAVHPSLAPVASGLTRPIAMAWRAGDQRMYVAEQSGTVRVVDDGVVASTPVLSLTVGGGNERGLLGIVFSPDGSKLYVDYTDTSGTIHVVEYGMGVDTANVGTARELLAITHPATNHNGGQMIIGPDHDLYIAVGDGGGAGDTAGNAQNLNVLLGKILRIDPTPSPGLPYTIPADNPFAGQAGKRGEIFMYGLRNPWRFTFDRDTGDLLIGDVGQGLYEEVDFAPAGQKGTNWGWNLREGFHAFNGAPPPGNQDPMLEASHDDGYCALIGGYVYRGHAIANLNGAYLFGDFCRSALTGVEKTGGTVVEQRDIGIDVNQLSAFGEDHDGELYVASLAGTVSKIVSTPPSLSIGDASIVEGNSGTTNVSVPLTLSAPSTAPVSVHWATANGTATAPGDFTAASGNATFPPGTTTASVSVAIVGDTVAEKPEELMVKLTAPVGATLADTSATVNVLDDDAPISVSVSDAVTVEGTGGTTQANFALSLSRPLPPGTSASVKVSTADATAKAATDYTAVPSTTVSFGPGEQTKNVPVSITTDATVENNETFKLNLKTPVGATIADAAGLGTIVNDDGNPTAPPKPSLAAGDATIIEADSGTTNVSVPITLSAPVAGTVTAHWAAAPGTAKAPGDYVASSGTVTFTPGQTSTTVSVPVVGDGVPEKAETFSVKLTQPVGATLADNAGTVNVLDNDAPISIVVSDPSVAEGDGSPVQAPFEVSLSRPVPAGTTVSVAVSTDDATAKAGTDYTAIGSTVVTFTAGQQTRTVAVSILGDTTNEKNETFKLMAKTPVGAVLADATGTATILNDD